MTGLIVTLLTVSIPLSSLPAKPVKPQPQVQVQIVAADYYSK